MGVEIDRVAIADAIATRLLADDAFTASVRQAVADAVRRHARARVAAHVEAILADHEADIRRHIAEQMVARLVGTKAN